MATVFDDPTGHPVTSTIAVISQQLRDVADLGLWTLGPTETDANLTALASLRHQINELELRHAHHAERLGLGTGAGATDTAAWWANTTRQTKRDAKRRLELSKLLDHEHEPVRGAMAAGQVSEDQALVIVRGVETLPVEHRRDAEAHLIGCAAEHDPSRCAGSRSTSSRSSHLTSPKSMSAKRWSGRRRWRRRRAGSRSPTTGTGCATAGSPSHPRSGRCSSRPSWR
jgi:hypothetical protein